MEIEIIRNDEKICLAKKVNVARSFFDRLLGLMFLKRFKNSDGLIIEQCKSIHTFFMRFSIDVVFFDKNLEIVKIIRKMNPWRMSGFYLNASSVLELPSNTIPDKVKKGDRLNIKCIN